MLSRTFELPEEMQTERHAAVLLGISHPRAQLDDAMLLTMARRLRPQMVEYLKVFGLTDAEAAAGSARVLARVDRGALAAQEAKLTPHKEIQCIERLMGMTVASFKSDMAMQQLLESDDSAARLEQQQRRAAKRRARKDKVRGQRRSRALTTPAAAAASTLYENPVYHPETAPKTAPRTIADTAPETLHETLHECRLCLEDVSCLATIVHADGSECQCVCATCAAIMPPTCLRCFLPIVHWFQEC